ncbi:hypothetical protein LZ30DRAFT_749783 [Colletotrichum cereale]|nr:hypothetical protein LZ30DRAFT_749783 [Colletotrichum cereale]
MAMLVFRLPQSNSDTNKTSAAPGAEPGPSVDENGVAMIPVTLPTKTEEDVILSPHSAPQTVVIEIPDDEERGICQNAQEAHSQQVEHLAARLTHGLRPKLHEYVRDKLTSNAHFGFSILRDVEVKTMKSLTNEASALIEGVLAQITGSMVIVTSQGIKREVEGVEEATAQDDRAPKRQRTRRA